MALVKIPTSVAVGASVATVVVSYSRVATVTLLIVTVRTEISAVRAGTAPVRM